MKNTMAPGIPLAIVLFAAVATVALRAASRRQEPRRLPGTEPEPVTADESRPQPPSAVEQMQDVFHELHPAGRNALCAVCDGQLARRARVAARLLRALHPSPPHSSPVYHPISAVPVKHPSGHEIPRH
jgi:hypothetical protein